MTVSSPVNAAPAVDRSGSVDVPLLVASSEAGGGNVGDGVALDVDPAAPVVALGAPEGELGAPEGVESDEVMAFDELGGDRGAEVSEGVPLHASARLAMPHRPSCCPIHRLLSRVTRPGYPAMAATHEAVTVGGAAR